MNAEKLTVAIIEDEKPAARLLESMLAKLRPQWSLVQVGGDIETAITWFATHAHPDLLFLDIRLSDGDSFVFIEQARSSSTIVFTTAYDQYAVRAFTVNSIDYLLKPIRLERLEKAIEKFERSVHRGAAGLPDLLSVLRSLANQEKKYRTRFLVAGVGKSITLPVDEIAYFYSASKLTFAVTRQNKEHVLDFSLDKLAEQLDPDRFFRANRHTILHIDAIVRIEPYFTGKLVVHTRPESREPVFVSKEKAAAFKLWLDY